MSLWKRLLCAGGLFALTVSQVSTQGVRQPRIYIADSGNQRIVRLDSMTGKGWTALGQKTKRGLEENLPTPAESERAPGHFSGPTGVFVDPNGQITVADTLGSRLLSMQDMTGKGWASVGTFGAEGKPGQLFANFGVTKDSKGRLYTLQQTGSLVRMDDMTGKGWTTYGQNGSGSGHFDTPSAVGVDDKDRIYIADTMNNRIVRIDDMTGGNWKVFGTQGEGANQFQTPYGLCLDSKGRLYIADTGNKRIVRMDDLTGRGWVTFGSVGTEKRLHGPTGIWVDDANRLYIADSPDRIVRIDDMTGKGWITYGVKGGGEGQFNSPTGICVR